MSFFHREDGSTIKNSPAAQFIFYIAAFFAGVALIFFIFHDLGHVQTSAYRFHAGSLFLFRVFLALILIRVTFVRTPRYYESSRFVWFCGISFFFWMLAAKWLEHAAFHTHAHDLGLFHSVLWNSAHGHFMVDAIRHQFYFSDHLIFLLVFLVPFYWIYSGPEMLFIFTAAAFAAGAMVIYLLAYARLKDRVSAGFLAIAFGLNRYIWGGFLHEFHPDFFAPAFFFLLFFSFYRKKKVLFLLSLFFILITKEDYSLYLIPVGVYFCLSRSGKRYGVVVLVSSVLYAWLAFTFLIPFFLTAAGKGSYAYTGAWAHLGGSFHEIAGSVLMHPVLFTAGLSWKTIGNFFLKFLFLPVLSPATFIFVLPPLWLSTSSSAPLLRGLSIHYGLIPVAMAFIGSIEGIRFIQARLKEKGILAARVAVSLLMLVGAARLTFYAPMPEANILHSEQVMLAAKQPLCVQSSVFPHLLMKGDFSIFPECNPTARYLLLHLNAETYPLSRQDFDKAVSALLVSGRWKILTRRRALLLLKRTA